MYQSETLTALAGALADFQRHDIGAKKNATNPHLKNKYADLSSIWEAIREPLAANGLAVVQLPVPGEAGTLRLRTQLLHMSGEWIASEIVMPLAKADPQGYGSALTYARRYALAAMLGVTQEDDDATAATRPTQAAQEKPAGDGRRRLTDAQIALAQAKRTEAKLSPSDIKRICAENSLPDSLGALWAKAEFDSLLNLIDSHAIKEAA